MSTLTIAENWTEFPSSPSVPFRTIFNPRECAAQVVSRSGIVALGRRLIRSRVLRLELVVVTTVVASGSFAWRTLGHESALQEAAVKQSRSIATLTDAVAGQDRKIADLNQSVERATRDLTAQMSRLSIQLHAEDKEMAEIQVRLSRVEIALRSGEQARTVGE